MICWCSRSCASYRAHSWGSVTVLGQNTTHLCRCSVGAPGEKCLVLKPHVAILCVHTPAFMLVMMLSCSSSRWQQVETWMKIKCNQSLISHLLLHLQIHEGVWVRTHRNMHTDNHNLIQHVASVTTVCRSTCRPTSHHSPAHLRPVPGLRFQVLDNLRIWLLLIFPSQVCICTGKFLCHCDGVKGQKVRTPRGRCV